MRQESQSASASQWSFAEAEQKAWRHFGHLGTQAVQMRSGTGATEQHLVTAGTLT